MIIILAWAGSKYTLELLFTVVTLHKEGFREEYRARINLSLNRQFIIASNMDIFGRDKSPMNTTIPTENWTFVSNFTYNIVQ